MERPLTKKYISLIYLLLIILAGFTAYYKVLAAGFISWDDADYVVHNNDIIAFNSTAISNWFRHFYIGNYHPLTMLSYAIDYMFGGRDPFQYHLTNILLHIANSVLLYFTVTRLQASKSVAFFVALLFVLHPVQTESVSWIAERKNVLYGFFFLGSMLLYTVYLSEERKSLLVWVFLAGVAAMLSKAAAVSLPLALLALDIWSHRPLKDKKVWLEKLPLLIAALILGIVAIDAQAKGQFLHQHSEYQWYHTLFFAGYAYIQYIVHLFVPVKLSVLYPYPPAIGVLQVFYTILSLGILALGYIAYRRKWYMLCGGILFYTVNIALVLQFVQFGEVLMADRYLYIPCIGILLPVVYYIFTWLSKESKEVLALAFLPVVCVVLLNATVKRNNIWLSEQNFWEAIVNTFPASSVAQSSIGGVYMKQGNYPHAMEHISEAIKIDPLNYKAWYNKGVLQLRIGEYGAAETAFGKCLEIAEYPKALFSRALLYQQMAKPLQALNDIDKVLEAEPENARAHFIKANCLAQNNNYEQAILSYNKAVEFGDGDPIFYMKRGITEIKMDKSSDAINDMGLVIAGNPQYAEAWYWRGIAKQQLGQEPCHDLNKARNLGFKEAEDALIKYCND